MPAHVAAHVAAHVSAHVAAQTSPQPSPFLEQIIRFLMPFFLGSATDFDAARWEILETLACYGARTRSQMLNAAQIIAFGMSVLETLGEVNATEMSPSLRLRYRACANSLNRSEQQHEKSLTARLARDQPDAVEPIAEPVNDLSQAEVQETVLQTQGTIDTHRNRGSNSRPAAGPQPVAASKQERNQQLWGSAMMDALAQMGMPVMPAPAAQAASPR